MESIRRCHPRTRLGSDELHRTFASVHFSVPCRRVGLASKDWKMPISCSVVYALRFPEKDTVMDHDG